jgi:hypothetical protein
MAYHDWQVWQYEVGHSQLHLRGIPSREPGGPCIELLFKPVLRLATSTMSWSGLRVGLRRVTPEGNGVFFLVGTRTGERHTSHAVIRAGSLSVADGGLTYLDRAIDAALPWRALWVLPR